MTRILDLTSSTDPRDVIHRVVQALVEGELVVLPVGGSYAVSALAIHADAVARLEQNAPAGTEGCLLLASSDAAADYLPLLSPSNERLLQRCWPGPVVFRFPVALPEGLGAELPRAAQRQSAPDDQLQLLVTASEPVLEVLRLLPAPLLARIPANAAAVMSEGAAADGQGFADLILEAGPVRKAGIPTVVRVSGEHWTIDRAGLVDSDAVRDAGCQTILFVCTGNTCRSPMAAAVFRKLLSARLQCGEDELPSRGYRVESAGLAASHGMPASPEAVQLVERAGGHLARHESRPLSIRLLSQADYVFTMTNAHRSTILQHHPEFGTRVRTLADDGSDISDPIGQGFDEYRRCLEQITAHVKRALDRLFV
ncbi:MAG: Sua5/YciO/YrdC/YwlC family protein [Planctomycetaceae bacterium]|nr:Sua5/YciO/YrdC/YwlC family protein [Planctomycetaceae bacterium]